LNKASLLHLASTQVLRLLEALDTHVMRLPHTLRAIAMRLRHLVGVKLTHILRLHAVAVRLLAKRRAILDVRTIAVLALEGLGLHPALSVLALGLHLEARRMLLLALHGEALRAHGMAATAAGKHLRLAAATTAGERLNVSAAVVSTTATTGEHRGMATAATASAVVLGLLVAPAATMRTRASRGCDRERGYAGREKHPGHHNISFRTGKTVRSLHRSNR
jgi:hypothetical protein